MTPPTSRLVLGAWLSVLPILSCQATEDADQVCQAIGEIPEIGFESQPRYLDSKTIVLTFDDGPDAENTPKILDILRSNDVKAAFFINTRNGRAVAGDATLEGIVRRMVEEGHELANHTVHHLDLAKLSEKQIEREIVGVEAEVRTLFGAGGPRLTLLRAPYGSPYLSARDSPEVTRVASIVAQHAVHVGWAMDSNDWRCTKGDAECVVTNVKGELDAGSYGILLMHSTHPQSAGALQSIIDEARTRGMKFASVEDVVRARYGRSSDEIIDGGAHGGG